MRRRWKWTWPAAALAGSVLSIALLSGARAPAATPARIDIGEFRYAPALLTVAPGTTVTWTNHDEETHTVTASGGAFASAGLESGESFAQTFASPGTYTYFCSLHPYMRATVVVE
jgi:plastocyanin